MKISNFKHNHYLLTLLLMLVLNPFLQSCKKEMLPQKSNIKESGIISKDIAMIVAKRYNYHLFDEKANANNSRLGSLPDSLAITDNGKQINNVVTLYDQSIPAAYIVNYTDNGGYLIVAADKNATPILAFGGSGNFADTIDAPDGLKEWVLSSVAQIDTIRTNNIQATTIIQKEWTLYSGGAVTYITQPPADPPCNYYYVNTYGPYLQSTWNQWCGYNDLCPFSSCNPTNYCWHTPTGCVATAMAQIMYFYKWPNSYNWNIMYNSTGSPECARLMFIAGLSVNMNYGCSSSGALASNVPGALVNTFNYKNTINRIDFGGQDLRNNLIYGKPIIVEGNNSPTAGHEWVCDGMQDIEWCNDDDYGNNIYGANTLYHMNWGWSGSYNNWYNFGAFNPGNFHFNSQVKAVINISPNR